MQTNCASLLINFKCNSQFLDFILTFNPEDFQAFTVQPPALTNDRYLVKCIWTYHSLAIISGKTHRDFARADYNTLFTNLRSLDWSVVFATCHLVNQYRETLHGILQQSMHDCVPVSRSRHNYNHHLPSVIGHLF